MTTNQSNAAAVVAIRGHDHGHGHASAPGGAPKATAAFTLSHKEARLLDLLVSLAAALLQPTAMPSDTLYLSVSPIFLSSFLPTSSFSFSLLLIPAA
jgi:hypothetical protein